MGENNTNKGSEQAFVLSQPIGMPNEDMSEIVKEGEGGKGGAGREELM
eukprot:CAMPEP_0202961936 /NCGR_PEP_ID=MMETSP1396-20130829/6034_1 /ASSEMBLY_ACC=CAM_ASM_000872 /TAXON_ID= /ORGANISM="Pseudokeronopsis sp., Strain Brazil" /LENGTH=47 /DNA_ID= /DNA_START= /DNA_END= /DNA_ORIENTATION=